MPKGIYKRTDYHKSKMSKGQMGHIVSEKTKRKISEANKGKKPSLESRKKMSEAHRGKKYRPMSLQGKENISRGKVGEKNPMHGKIREQNPNWKGGLTPLRMRIRELGIYKKWRKTVFERDNYTCQECDKKGEKIQAHHLIHSFASLLHKYNILSVEDANNCIELWDIKNGQTLCKPCHKETDNYLIYKKDVQQRETSLLV